MDYLALCQEVCGSMDYHEPTTLITPDTETKRVMRQVNLAYNTIWLKLNRGNEDAETSTTLALTAGVDSYNIPATLTDITLIVMADTTVCRIVPWPEFELRKNQGVFNTQADNSPQDAAIYQRKIHFYPEIAASQTVSIRGRLKFADLSADDDEPMLRSELHRSIVELAKYYEMVYEGNPDVAVQQEIVREWLTIAKNVQRTHSELPPRMMSEDEWVQTNYRAPIEEA